MTQVKTVARVLLDAGDWMLTSDIAAEANMLDKPTHVSAILNNLRVRDFVQSEKGIAGGSEQRHRVVEPQRAQFVAWINRDRVAPPTRDAGTKKRASEKSAQQHRIDGVMGKPRTLSQMASAAEADDEAERFAEVHGGVEHRVIKPADGKGFGLGPDAANVSYRAERADAAPSTKLTIREFYDAVTKVLGIPPTWIRVCITIDNKSMPIIVADLEPPAILLGVK